MLAGVLLWLALRGLDAEALAQTLGRTDLGWLAPLVAVALVSHALRAWRWHILLEALPSGAPRRVSLKTAFYSVMIGYMVNNAVPRLGELARTANLAAREGLRFGGVLGTVVVERLVDLAVLAVVLLTVALALSGRLAEGAAGFLAALGAGVEGAPVAAVAAVGLAVAAGALALRVRQRGAGGGVWAERVRPALAAFGDGLRTVGRSPRRGALVAGTVAMWGCYWLMAYLPLLLFGMAGAYGLGLGEAWALMALGAVGVSVPAPGGVGSYHYVTVLALVHLFGTPEGPAAAYALLTHAIPLVLYTVVGALCLVLQGGPGPLRRALRAERVPEG